MATFDASIGMSLSMMPACMVARVAFWCFLATLTPSTMTLPSLGMTRMIDAVLAAVLALEDDDAVALLQIFITAPPVPARRSA